jgi:hypothetical protein
MWRQMVPQIRAAVVGPIHDQYLGNISPITQHVVSVIAAQSADEAHYVCAMLNSSIATCISASYSTGKSYGTPSMLEHVPIPMFSKNNTVHLTLAELSCRAHAMKLEGRQTDEVEIEIDNHAAAIYGVIPSDLPSLRAEAMRIGNVCPASLLPLAG